MKLKDFMKDRILCLDGGTGTLLQAEGLCPGEAPETWNITHPEVIRGIYRAYYEAGSHMVTTNTFGVNGLKYGHDEMEKMIRAAVALAKEAKGADADERFIALDVGPSGKMLQPYGDLGFEDAVRLFSEVIAIGAPLGVDAILIETMNDSYETKAAILAAKEQCDLPIFCSNAYGEDGKLMTGASPEAMVAMAEGLGVSAIGANCSLGPKQLKDVAHRLLAAASVPVLLKPNAGLPRVEDGVTTYDVSEREFAGIMAELAEDGVRVIGGCCGTTPQYIRCLKEATDGLNPVPVRKKAICCISSYTHSVTFGASPVLIGERINPTGKKRLAEALRSGDTDYLLTEAVRQTEAGCHVLDVNVGLPEIDEAATLEKTVFAIQGVTDLPLQIDTADAGALGRAMRIYNGKPLVNSVSGKKSVMDAVFPLVKKYGGTVIALTLSDDGIPETADGRIEVAKAILDEAARYGLGKEDLIFDPLAMTVSTDPNAALVTLETLRRLHDDMGCYTSLGISNVSFGLPSRNTVNASFFTMALGAHLSAAIMNPFSEEMMGSYYAFRALTGQDENCREYIAAETKDTVEKKESTMTLKEAIGAGLKELSGSLAETMLKEKEPLCLVNEDIIPALDAVGRGFEEKNVYLPQLLMSAEAAKSAFDAVKAAMAGGTKNGEVFVLATVKGDIHDIGKNIVRLLLENYGFTVIDLGKDVAPERVAEACITHKTRLVGLSALMTTTVPAMEETIRLLRKRVPDCRIVVGGAVLTEAYAKAIGADFYASDAMETVRYALEQTK